MVSKSLSDGSSKLILPVWYTHKSIHWIKHTNLALTQHDYKLILKILLVSPRQYYFQL